MGGRGKSLITWEETDRRVLIRTISGERGKILELNHTKPEQLKLARLRADLRATGVDVDLQAGVIEGYVLAESRIARLRAEEAQAVRVGRSGPEVRALNVALGEQRRLHQILFGRRASRPSRCRRRPNLPRRSGWPRPTRLGACAFRSMASAKARGRMPLRPTSAAGR